MTVVAIFANGVVVIERLSEGGARVERRLNIIDTAAVVVVGGVAEDAKFFVMPKTRAGCTAKVIRAATVLDRRVAAIPEEI